MTKLLGQPEAELLDLVTAELALAGEILLVLIGTLERRGIRGTEQIGFDGDLCRIEPLQHLDHLRHLGLALGREHIVGPHVVDVLSVVRHVVGAED